MHERHLLMDLLRKAEQVCREAGAARVTRLHVFLGALSHLDEAHFMEHFIDATRGTVLEGASVKITTGKDMTDPHAQDVMLLDVEVEDAPPSASAD